MRNLFVLSIDILLEFYELVGRVVVSDDLVRQRLVVEAAEVVALGHGLTCCRLGAEDSADASTGDPAE